ncbi:MAG: CvpA family protein [Thermodesulfobacteriota bacterium]
MTSIDSAIILIISLLAARGVWTGFIRQAAFIAALVLAFMVAGRFYGYYSGFMGYFISTPQLAFMLTYMLLFAVVYLGVVFSGVGLKKVVKVSMLGGFDRVMGGLFGMGKGMFITILVFMVLAGLLSNSATFLSKSYFYPFLNNGSKMVMSMINDPELRSGFRPKEPAISSVFEEELGYPEPRQRTISPEHQRALDDLRYQLARDVGDRPRR